MYAENISLGDLIEFTREFPPIDSAIGVVIEKLVASCYVLATRDGETGAMYVAYNEILQILDQEKTNGI